jgi:hypothetical protein
MFDASLQQKFCDITDPSVRIRDVRFGSEADICAAISDVRIAPNSDRESGLSQAVMSALSPKADIRATPNRQTIR